MAQNTGSVTFEVDMRQVIQEYNEEVLTVELRGNKEPLFWSETLILEDKDGDGVYATTISFNSLRASDTVLYKYVLNGYKWEDGENRVLTYGTGKVIDTFRYIPDATNPFKRFLGEWTLKDSLWYQTNGFGIMDTITVNNHYSVCREINTKNSLLWEVDSNTSMGHILWAYNVESGQVQHLSSFYPARSGVGKGQIEEAGDIMLKITFEGEGDTYRIYTYKWISDDEYVLQSTQYSSSDDQATGQIYGGTFIRLKAKTD